MDTDSEADSNASNRRQQQEQQQHTAGDDSSEEEWTYTSTRMEQQNETQKSRSRAKMRLDFGNAAATQNDTNEDSDVLNGNIVDDVTDKNVGKKNQILKLRDNNNSDDECINNKEGIQRLIREVSFLSGKNIF